MNNLRTIEITRGICTLAERVERSPSLQAAGARYAARWAGRRLAGRQRGADLLGRGIRGLPAQLRAGHLRLRADLAAGTLCGLWNGVLVAKARIQPMVATLILMVAGRGIAQLITNGQIMTIYYTPYFENLGIPFIVNIVLVVKT